MQFCIVACRAASPCLTASGLRAVSSLASFISATVLPDSLPIRSISAALPNG